MVLNVLDVNLNEVLTKVNVADKLFPVVILLLDLPFSEKVLEALENDASSLLFLLVVR